MRAFQTGRDMQLICLSLKIISWLHHYFSSALFPRALFQWIQQQKQTGNQRGVCFVSPYLCIRHPFLCTSFIKVHSPAFSPKDFAWLWIADLPVHLCTTFPPQKNQCRWKTSKDSQRCFTQSAEGGPTGKRWPCCSVIQGWLCVGKKRM